MSSVKHFCFAMFLAFSAQSLVITPVLADSSHSAAGAGTRLCSAFLREYEQNPTITAWIYLSWAQGYLSAVNLQRAHLGESSVDMLPPDFDLPLQIGFLRAFCERSPDRHFDQAAIEMYYELLARNSTIVGSRPDP